MSLAFGIVTQNSSWEHFYLFDFKRPAEICIKEKRVGYAEFIILLCTVKGSVNMDSNVRVLLLDF